MILALALLLAAPADAQLFSDANAAFLSGDLARAIASYEALVSEGMVSPELETNLGTAYLRQGKRGLAALHYERALFLDPGDDDARVNLTEVRRGNVDKLEGEAEDGGMEALARALAPLPGPTAALLLFLLWDVAWVLLGVRLFFPEKKWAGAAAGAVFGAAGLAAVITWGAATGRSLALQRAVIVAQSAPAREGPGDKSVSHFEIHEGTTVRVEDEEGQFKRVKLANGLVGWVPNPSLELVVPPGWAGRPVMASSPRAALP